jgi:hypothetical protein
MNELSPRDLPRDGEPSKERDELWSEALSGLALIGAVLLIVFVMTLAGRL